jgi:hypothetical protein
VKDRTVDEMLKCIFESKCSIDLPAEGEEVLELCDQSTGGQRMGGKAHVAFFSFQAFGQRTDLFGK